MMGPPAWAIRLKQIHDGRTQLDERLQSTWFEYARRYRSRPTCHRPNRLARPTVTPMDLEIRHLKVVCAIAETGSVTKAAAVLGLAQPALTAQLQRIERILGGPLFERDRRGARPTALGELVLSRARVLLRAMKGLEDEAARPTLIWRVDNFTHWPQVKGLIPHNNFYNYGRMQEVWLDNK